ncbi:MAG: transcription-repair coupling factor, partial [Erysipelotrichaceae bacterium]|nr:transcription-repair coupling factor [Erysipelotrichaceae bacterium]
MSLNVKDDASCMVVVKENTYTASLLYERLICFMKKEDVILYIPEESLRVEAIASSFENKAMRMEAMYQMLTKKYRIVITSSNAIVKRLPNPKEFLRQCHTVKINEECSLQDFKQKLLQAGYTQVHRVEHPLTFSMRGGIIDVFSINYEQPIRIEFFDTVIDSLRFFDVNTQKTVSITKEVDIICASDVLFTKED